MAHHPSPTAQAAAAALLLNPNADLRTQIGNTPTCGLCDTQHPADSKCPDPEEDADAPFGRDCFGTPLDSEDDYCSCGCQAGNDAAYCPLCGMHVQSCQCHDDEDAQ